MSQTELQVMQGKDTDELLQDRLINYFKEKSEKSCRLMGELGIYLQSFLFFISFSSLLSNEYSSHQ